MILKYKSLIFKNNYDLLRQLNFFIRNNSNFKKKNFTKWKKYITLRRFFKLKIIVFDKKYFYLFLEFFKLII